MWRLQEGWAEYVEVARLIDLLRYSMFRQRSSMEDCSTLNCKYLKKKCFELLTSDTKKHKKRKQLTKLGRSCYK